MRTACSNGRARKTGREIGLLGMRQQSAVEHLPSRIRPGDSLTRPHVAAQKHQRASCHLRHAHRIERDVEGISYIWLPARLAFRFKRIGDDGIPILEGAICGDNRNSFARPFVGEWMVRFTHRVGCRQTPCAKAVLRWNRADRSPWSVHRRRRSGMLPILAIQRIQLRQRSQHGIRAARVTMVGSADDRAFRRQDRFSNSRAYLHRTGFRCPCRRPSRRRSAL